GLRTHVGPDGLRPWLEVLEAGIAPQVQSSLRVFARGEKVQFKPDDDPPPIVETAFLSRLEEVTATELGPALYDNHRRVMITCAEDAARNLDFSVFSAGREVFHQDAAWAALTAPAAGRARALHLLELVKLNAYRYFHRKDRDDRRAEFIAFAAA